MGQENSFAALTYSSVANQVRFLVSDYGLEILSWETTEAGELIRGNGSLNVYSSGGNALYQPFKFIGAIPDRNTMRPSGQASSANFIVYRLADLYLMKAEAYSQKGSPDFEKALEYLNAVRTRSNMQPYTQVANAQAFEDLILMERAKELAFEGKRWFDLLRMGRRNNYARKDKLIDILIQNVTASQKLVFKSRFSDPNGWYMPIHQSEIIKNRNLTQNPFYDER
jgi:starch-binding outer membrane protein, SusD/RagB family